MTTKRFGPYTVELSREKKVLFPDWITAVRVPLADGGRHFVHACTSVDTQTV